MRRADAIAKVIDLACETQDRAPEEQRALLYLALDIDTQRAAFTVTNAEHAVPARLAQQVLDTYQPDSWPRVEPTKPQSERMERLAAKWQPCERCGSPIGAHGADVCQPKERTP